jgi:triacylglycerol lipase
MTTESVPMYFPNSFDLSAAVTCSQLVNTAYDMYHQWVAQYSPEDPSSFHWKPKGPSLTYSSPIWGTATMAEIPYLEPFAFVAQDAGGITYLAFRGSETDADFAEDADVDQVTYSPVADFGLAHSGFMSVYTTEYSWFGDTYPSLQTSLLGMVNNLAATPTALYITAHSLGSGLATLCVPDIMKNSYFSGNNVPVYCYSLASPRVGDPTFAYAYNFNLSVPTYRIFNTEDIVPDGPPAVLDDLIYEHVGIPVCFTAQYGSTAGNHDYEACYYYALENPGNPQGPIVSEGNYVGLEVAQARRRHDLLKGKRKLKSVGPRASRP